MRKTKEQRKIESLTRQLASMEINRNYFRDLYIKGQGQQIVNWKQWTDSQACDSLSLAEFKAGDKIKIVGTVVKSSSDFCYNNGAYSSRVEYVVETTSRLPK
jgi:hypothetical protein